MSICIWWRSPVDRLKSSRFCDVICALQCWCYVNGSAHCSCNSLWVSIVMFHNGNTGIHRLNVLQSSMLILFIRRVTWRSFVWIVVVIVLGWLSTLYSMVAVVVLTYILAFLLRTFITFQRCYINVASIHYVSTLSKCRIRRSSICSSITSFTINLSSNSLFTDQITVSKALCHWRSCRALHCVISLSCQGSHYSDYTAEQCRLNSWLIVSTVLVHKNYYFPRELFQ